MSRAPGRLRTALVLAAVFAVVAGGVWLVQGRGSAGGAGGAARGSGGVSQVQVTAQETGPAPAVGQPAPLFTQFDTTGQPVVLEDLRGRPVWLVFGATWCANCRAEMPDVAAAARELGGAAHVVAVQVGESVETVADYADRLGLDFPQVADAYTEIGAKYRVMGIPMHVFLDSEGVVTDITLGQLTKTQALSKLATG